MFYKILFTLDYPVYGLHGLRIIRFADCPVCGLSVREHKLLMTNDESGE